jgi:hypothetical protein
MPSAFMFANFYTEAGKAIGFALEQPLHVVALPCSALQILKRLQHNKNPDEIFVTVHGKLYSTIVFRIDSQSGIAR